MSQAWTVEQLLEHAEWIRKLAHVLVRDPALADDLAQDTWVAALRSPPKQQGPLKPWLATILRNLVRERARGNERRARREQASPPPAAAEPVEDLAQRAEAQRLLVEFVLELPQHYRDVVLLSYFEGLSGPEIADRLGVPEVTVRSRLKRGLDQLRERFDRKYGERKAWIVMLLPLAKRPGDGVGGRGRCHNQHDGQFCEGDRRLDQRRGSGLRRCLVMESRDQSAGSGISGDQERARPLSRTRRAGRCATDCGSRHRGIGP